jgi:hypothetical protein
MPQQSATTAGTPLDRIYGVNSHVALGMLARWSRGLDIPIERLARALVDGAPRDEASP